MNQSSFTALNLSDDELDIEEHTRELQIEIALNILNKALEFQKNQEFEKAHSKYDELGRIEILQLPNDFNNPTIDRLKYLYSRNRGMLRLRELIDQSKLKHANSESKPDDGDASDSNGVSEEDDDLIEISVYGEIIGAINDLLNATLYGEPDEKIIQILASLFEHFNYPRMARLCYELKFGNDDNSKMNDDLKIDLSNPKTLLLNQSKLMNNYFELLNKLEDNHSALYKKIRNILNDNTQLKKFLKKYDWNLVLSLEDWNSERLNNKQKNQLTIDVEVHDGIVNINSLLNSLVECLPKPKGRSKIYDSYLLTEKMVDDIKLDFNITVTEELNDTLPNNEQIDDTNVEVIKVDNDKSKITIDKNIKQTDSKPESLNGQNKEVTSISRPSRNLRAKPESDSNDHAKTVLKNYDIFISQTLPSFLSLCGLKLNLNPLSDLIFNKSPKHINESVIKFYNCLSHWNDEYSQCLIVSNEKKGKSLNSDSNDNESIKELLNVKSSKVISYGQLEKLDISDLYPLLNNIDGKEIHFNQIRIEVVKYIFKLNPKTFTSLICVHQLTKKALKNFKNIVESINIQIFNQFEDLIMYNSTDVLSDKILSDINIAVSIYEILIDSYLEINKDLKLKKSGNKQLTAENQFNESILLKRIEKWNQILEDTFTIYNYGTSTILTQLWCRFKWFQLFYVQTCPGKINAENLITTLSELSGIVHEQQYYLPYVNYELILVLSYENIQTQFSKLKILEIFDKYEKSNEILESVLLNLEYKEMENHSIKKQFETFLTTSNLPMKLRLWSLLLRYYRINGNIDKYKIAFEKIIDMIFDGINDENLENVSEEQSKFKILNILGFFNYFCKQFIQFCNDTKFQCFNNNTQKESSKMMAVITSILYMLYSFLMYQKAVQIDGRISISSKSSESNAILTNCISSCFFLLSAYYSNALLDPKEESINDFLSVCHIELGLRGMCSSLNGTFLKFLQYKLSSLHFNISANDVFQIIHCRFGFSVCLEGFETFDHKCKPKKMAVDDAIQLSKYVSTYCFKGRHPILSPPRNDIKNIIDKIIDILGDPENSNQLIISNKQKLNDYLFNTRLDLNFIINVFNAKVDIAFEKPNFLGMEIADNGLYYLEGLLGLHLFKIRKRTIQSRASELDYVLKMLENDILCGCNRFESWLALGQTYSFLVEDDLIWTADKLNSAEKKQATSMTQKKALICYLTAIAIYLKLPSVEKEKYKAIVSTLWESFAKELYNAWMEPMNKKAFHISIDKQESNENTRVLKSTPNDIPYNAVIKILELAFRNASDIDSASWYDMMYLAKTQYKLQYHQINTDVIVDNLLKACSIALKQSNKEDPIIEPHYYLFSIITKLVKSSNLSVDEAVKYFQKDSLFENIFPEDEPIVQFDEVIYKVLQRIIQYDKKNWQHKPVYRLAKTYYDSLHDIQKAKEEMLSIINLKPNIRSLSTIWKPSSERSGRHFIYNSIYTQFLVQLLYETGDIYSLTILLKKMRRAGSIMVNLTKTFDNMMLRIIVLIKKSLSLKPGFLDESIAKVKFLDFTKYSNEFVNMLKTEKVFDDSVLLHLFFLSETQTFRKLATGFGATGLIDECYHSIYVKLFIPFLFKRIVEDKSGGLSISELLEEANKFSLEKSNKLKQSSTDLVNMEGNANLSTDIYNEEITVSNTQVFGNDQSIKSMESQHFEKFDKEEHADRGDGANLEIAESQESHANRELSIEDQYSIINYLSYGKNNENSNSNKEKTRVARRDVSPFAVKVVSATHEAVEKLREETNDGETINYNIQGPLDDTEFEKASSSVMAKETKENKEDKEFEKLISAHDRSFTETEILEFNNILAKFNIEKLINSMTKLESERLEQKKNEKAIEVQRKLELLRLRYELKRDISSSPAAMCGPEVSSPVPSLSMKEKSKEDAEAAENGNLSTEPDPLISSKSNSGTVARSVEKEAKSDEVNTKDSSVRNVDASVDRPIPAKSTQSVITKFFKVSPSKTNLPPNIDETYKRKGDDDHSDMEPKRPKVKQEVEAAEDPILNNLVKLEPSVNASTSDCSSPRRNSRRGVSISKLLELDDHGAIKEQSNLKEKNKRKLMENVEVLSSSSDEDSIIIID